MSILNRLQELLKDKIKLKFTEDYNWNIIITPDCVQVSPDSYYDDGDYRQTSLYLAENIDSILSIIDKVPEKILILPSDTKIYNVQLGSDNYIVISSFLENAVVNTTKGIYIEADDKLIDTINAKINLLGGS